MGIWFSKIGQCAQRGTVLVESALIVPLTLFLVFGAYELSQIYNDLQRSTTAAGESARISLGDCSADPDVSGCLDTIRQKIEDYWQGQAVPLELVISIYNYDDATGNVSRTGVAPANGETTSGHKTRYTTDRVDQEVVALDRDKPNAAIAEAFLEFDSGRSFVGRTFFVGVVDELYTTAIF